jgi:glycosyltransferase involved in cell wall biosynthesis
MRILLLHSSSDNYGASKIFSQTVLLLKNNGHYPVVVLSKAGSLSFELEKHGVDVHIINLAILRRKYFNLTGIVNRYKKWKVALPALYNIISSYQIDTIYSNTAAVLIGGYVAKKRGLKHIWHLHEIIDKPVLMHYFLAKFLRKWSDKIIVVSKAVAANWQDALPHGKTTNISKPQMFQIYNGILSVPRLNEIPNTHFTNYKQSCSIPENALVIGMAARIHFWKGHSYFVEIATALLNCTEDITLENNIDYKRPIYFLIAGDPFPGYEYLQTELEQSLLKHSLTNRIFYIGLVNEMDLFYKSIDLLILPSQQPDPLPTVILEAMQYGLPVVATAQGGALEMVVENETGIFIPLNNPDEAAQKIITILNMDKLHKLGVAGKQRVEEYFSSAMFEKKMLSIFEQ